MGSIKNIDEVLVENSTYDRKSLKIRLYKSGLRDRKCELCGQTEDWNGKKMSLVLDHINGANNDNRIENLRIVCPNCNATLETFSGRNRKRSNTNICECGLKKNRQSKKCNKCYHFNSRKSERPSIEILIKDIEDLGYVGCGKKYGVSDNSIRKWLI
jgi:hypothetical protein